MRGWLVVNDFLRSNKFDEIHLWLLESAKKVGLELILRTNGELLMEMPINQSEAMLDPVDFVLFWDKDIRLAQYLEQLGYVVFNSSKAIGICDDKTQTHLTFMNHKIPMPRTVILPMTYANVGYTNLDFLKGIVERLEYPMIVKEGYGSFGQQVYMVHNLEELQKCITTHAGTPLLIQEFIVPSNGRDIRLQVVGGKVVAAMYRYSENGDFRANISNGGSMKSYNPTPEQEKLAVDCCEILGLDFAGVDLLFGENEKPILCEVNSNAHFKNIYDATGINVADYILSYIKDRIIRDYV